MKRLFCVKDCNGKIVETFHGLYMENKLAAKGCRDAFNSAGKNEPYTVSRGPDHIGPHGNKISRYRLQPKHVASYTGL